MATGAHRHRLRHDGGVAAVEFVLVLPLLIILVFGIIQFGITLAGVLALNNAARQGARVGVVALNTCDTVMAQVFQGSSSIGVKYPVTVTVSRSGGGGTLCTATVSATGATSYSTGTSTTVACPSGNVGNRLTVKAASTSSFTIPPVLFIKTYTITGNGVFQCENS
jgi:Flp pilus assembly protein TadG